MDTIGLFLVGLMMCFKLVVFQIMFAKMVFETWAGNKRIFVVFAYNFFLISVLIFFMVVFQEKMSHVTGY